MRRHSESLIMPSIIDMKVDRLRRIAVPAVDQAMRLLPKQMDTQKARVALYAIGLQESDFLHRYQVLGGTDAKGPARSFWQFEEGGGCRGVIGHDASRYWMHEVCKARNCAFTTKALWTSMETDDALGAAAARLLLFTDPRPLPELGQQEQMWATYIWNWRPGLPHKGAWPSNYEAAMIVVTGKSS